MAGLLAFGACSCATAEAEDFDPSGSISAPMEKETTSSYALASPELPKQAPYPDEQSFSGKDGTFDPEGFNAVWNAWNEDVKARRASAQSYPGKLDDYLKKTAEAFLTPEEADGNAVCSPINIWMALAMAAETADGSTRQEILDLLGAPSIEALRQTAKALWTANYCDDGACTSKMSASLWMDQDVMFKESTIQRLADDYYAGTFRGDMGGPAYSKAFKDWLNESTGGLLKDAVQGLEDFKPEDVMALATAICFKAAWSDKFSESSTYPEVFHGAKNDVETDFMHRGGTNTYYWSDHFGAVSLPFEDAGEMWLLLPDEGVTPAELLASGEAMDFLLAGQEWRGKNSKFLVVDMAVPRFDVEADMDLKAKLQALGVSRMFSSDADLSNLSDMEGLYVGSAKHDARVKIDEEGCEAAAFTVMMYCGAAMPPDERMEFRLDRPFLFAVTGVDGLPLFCGVVNQLQ